MSEKQNIKPIGGNILVRPLDEEEKTASGLILQTSGKEKPQKGEIVALGTGKKDKEGKEIPWSVTVGDTVLFKKYSPEEIEVNGQNYLIMQEDDILAVIVK